MSWTFQTTNSAGDSSGSTLAITKPASTADGDLLIAVIYWEGTSASVTPPANWNTVTGYPIRNTGPSPDMAMWVFWKIASGEGASFTFSGPNEWRTGAVGRWNGNTGGAGDYVDVASTPQQGNAANVTVSAVTTTADSESVLVALSDWAGNNFTRSSGSDPTTTRVLNFAGVSAFHGVQTTAGDTGTGVYTAGTVDYAAGRVAFKDTVGGGGGGTPATVLTRMMTGVGL